jgi:hypothetical protein
MTERSGISQWLACISLTPEFVKLQNTKVHEDWDTEILNMLKISADEYMTC